MQTKILTDAEQRLAALLGECFNLFKQLPVYHPSDMDEFVRAIHAAQNIVLARPGYASQAHLTGLWEQRQKELAPPLATTSPANSLYYQLMDLLIEAKERGIKRLVWQINQSCKQMLMDFQHKGGQHIVVAGGESDRLLGYPIIWREQVEYIELIDQEGDWVGQIKRAVETAK